MSSQRSVEIQGVGSKNDKIQASHNKKRYRRPLVTASEAGRVHPESCMRKSMGVVGSN